MIRPFALFAIIALNMPIAIQAQDLSDAALEVRDRLPPDQRVAYAERYGFDLTVPIDVIELTSDVFAITVSCQLYSSYMTNPETVIAEGRTIVIDKDTVAASSANFEMVWGEAHWVESAGSPFQYNGSLAVPMIRTSGVAIESWTHGDCTLKLLAWDGEGGGFNNRRQLDPIECAYGSVSDPWQISACHSRQLEFRLNTFSQFGRLGYDNNGRLLE